MTTASRFFLQRVPPKVGPVFKGRLLAVVALALLVLSACGSPGSGTEWTFGDSLVTRVKATRFVEEAGYELEGKHYVIRPSRDDRVLMAALLEVFNSEANVVYISVRKDSVSLRDTDSFEYRPLDPFEDSIEVSTPVRAEGELLPFLWADGSEHAPTIDMPPKCGENNENCQLVGWVLFEVPRNIEPRELVWEAADTIYMRF